MKELLAVLSLLVSGGLAEPPAPYPPSGWRPSGPSFELPQRGQQGQQPQNQRYLPPVDPRNQVPGPSAEEDVSVQGLPQPEQRPLFQASPISGQQYAGPNFNQDLRNLEDSYQQSQYEQQQARYREYQRQKQLESTQTTPKNRLPATNPRQFASTTEASTQVTSTTSFDLNQEEVLSESEPAKPKTTVEVTKQNVKEYSGEFFLSSLAQLQLQPQFVPLQTVSGQYNQPQQPSRAYIQPQSQKQVAGFDGPAHFSALPSVLAQQAQNGQGIVLAQQQSPGFLVQNEQPLLVQQPISQFAQAQVQTQYQPDSVVLPAPGQFQPNVYIKPNPDAVAVQPTSQYAPANSYQPGVQPQFIAKPVAFQPQQPNFAQQPEDENQDQNQQLQDQYKNQQQQNQVSLNQQKDSQNQQQFYQQPIVVQPQNQFSQPQNQYDQSQNQYDQAQYAQPQLAQGQFVQPQPGQLQPQFLQPGQPQTQFLQPQAENPQNQYTQPQLAPQNQYAQPSPQPEVQFLQPQYAEPQNQYGQPQTQFGQPQTQFGQPQTQFGPPQMQFGQPQAQLGQPQMQFGQSQAQLGQPQMQFGQLQAQFLQPQSADFQNQYLQPQFAQQLIQFGQPQTQFLQPQLADPQNQYLQPEYAQPQTQYQQSRQSQGQDNLQSGLDINQEGNDIDEPEDKEEEGATAVATAFGTRTQARVNTRYGAPFPPPKVQANSATTESAVEDITEGPAVAEAVAVGNGERRKSARLRSRRIRPVYALDRSGRIVLAEA